MKKQRRKSPGRKSERSRVSRGRKSIPRTSSEWESHYDELAEFYESDASLAVMAQGIPMPTAKLRQLSKQNAKLISIRMPMLDLLGIKRIAARKALPYQKLIIQAVERMIDEEEQKELRNSKLKDAAK